MTKFKIVQPSPRYSPSTGFEVKKDKDTRYQKGFYYKGRSIFDEIEKLQAQLKEKDQALEAAMELLDKLLTQEQDDIASWNRVSIREWLTKYGSK